MIRMPAVLADGSGVANS